MNSINEAIRIEDVSFSYAGQSEQSFESQALNRVNLMFKKKHHIAVLGRNGSGKSTLAKLINGLLLPSEGNVIVFGKNTNSSDYIWEIRQSCGMVFQNPDNQIVGTTVEEDVAFGPENLGVPSNEIRERVDRCLALVGLSEYAKKSPSQLSGGQKQKLAIAGILAMQPQCIILDEATSMLDPQTSHDLMNLIQELRDQFSLTIIDITHDIQNAILADYIFVLNKGEILAEGTPREIFTQDQLLVEAGLEFPRYLDVFKDIQRDIILPESYFTKAESNLIFTEEEVIAEFESLKEKSYIAKQITNYSKEDSKQTTNKSIIQIEHLNFSYQRNTSQEVKALNDISFSISEGELITIIGHSGSGKSTLISHLNGLIQPQTGKVRVMDYSTSEDKDIREIRRHVGLLFQYPEHQLFENTVYEDITFGPRQFKFDEKTIEENVKKAIQIVNIDESILKKSPFELSGGQQRRVAIAGVISMDSDIYVLDEPAAGLDPVGREEIFSYISELRKLGKTIILITHDMNLAAELSDRVMVLSKGELIGFDVVEKIFSNSELLKEAGLREPDIYHFSNKLSNRLEKPLTAFRKEELKHKLMKYLAEGTGDNHE